jgi:hypothetical protein
MLTLDECRALLGPVAPESDSDVEALRDLVGALAEAVLDSLPAADDRAAVEAS